MLRLQAYGAAGQPGYQQPGMGGQLPPPQLAPPPQAGPGGYPRPPPQQQQMPPPYQQPQFGQQQVLLQYLHWMNYVHVQFVQSVVI